MKPFKHHIDPYNVALETSKNDCYIHITLITFSVVFFRAQQNPRRASSHGADHPGRNTQVPLEAFKWLIWTESVVFVELTATSSIKYF